MKYSHFNIVAFLFVLSSSIAFAQYNHRDSTVKDIDGNVYKTVRIGNQIWMAENLKTTHYRNGDPILTTVPDTLNYSAEAMPKYQWAYNGDERNVAIYGRLYTWYAATDSRNVCPEGFHLPSINEWIILDKSLGGKNEAIGKLKAIGTQYWKAPNSDATNESGFNGLPCGWRSAKGHFNTIGLYGHWWASTRENTEWVYRMFLSYDNSCYRNHLGSADPQTGWAVRCVKNNSDEK